MAGYLSGMKYKHGHTRRLERPHSDEPTAKMKGHKIVERIDLLYVDFKFLEKKRNKKYRRK
jgi:hypothetical protein